MNREILAQEGYVCQAAFVEEDFVVTINDHALATKMGSVANNSSIRKIT